ncbi:N-acyl homoserine lactonase family protein [Pendulispora brunnea]|uniref:N-acyl homoserine lactonase family protein n=1 Tax=Pendulispora brunnea TaxID=2905690 RepID=A0ABZ2K7T2_9BACT
MISKASAWLSMALGLFTSSLSVACSDNAKTATAASESHRVQLYTLECGHFQVDDMGFFSADGKPTGKGERMPDPCFVIRHPKGVLLWDTGLKDSTAQSKEGVKDVVGREFVDVPLSEQLKALSLSPSDITFVGLSHLHADHAGNANQFTSSTWLVNRRELENGTKTPPAIGIDPSVFSDYRKANIKLLDGDYDVFGDGSVRILQTPGHTPGHQSLELRLTNSGTVILSGDLAHSRENWAGHIAPSWNFDRAQTQASMERIEGIIRTDHARFVIQHDPEDFASLPKAPAFLD